MNRCTIVTATLLAAALIASGGCRSAKTGDWKLAKALDVRRAMWWKEHKPDPQVPVRLVSSWTDTVLHRAGQKSQRGFGGRLSFFSRESEDPVRVDGQLVVYAYDESKGDPTNTRPTRRYIFPKEQFERMESESTLGPSYSVWLPWDDEVAGERKNISLIARFEPQGGPLLVGEQTKHLLPGTPPPGDIPSMEPTQGGIQLAQYADAPSTGLPTNNASADGSRIGPPEMTAKSIQMSEHLRERFSAPTVATNFRERYSPAATEPTMNPSTNPSAEAPRQLFPRQSTRDPRRSDRPTTGFPPATLPAATQSSFR